MRRTVAPAVVLAVALSAGSCAGPAPQAVTPRSPPAARPRTTPLFEFHSGAWVNLHQRLVAEATANQYWHAPVTTCPCAKSPDGAVMPAWTEAVAGYKKELEGRSTVMDAALVRLNVALAIQGSRPAALTKDIDPNFAKWLDGTYEPYTRGSWPADDARNRAFIAAVEPLVAKWGGEMAAELAERFETTWPTAPIRVEITQYAGFGGAQTTGDPILTVMSSDDAGYAAPAALEMLFHEASHGLDAILDHDLQMAFIAKGKREPRSLDHAIIFYTAGELARRRLGPSYVPYAYKQGVWERGWQKLEVAVRTHWKPWLDGEIDLPTALARLADAFPE